MRSSVPPLAKTIFCGWDGSGFERGESARHRTAEAWAWKRKVSANCTAGEDSEESTFEAFEEVGMVAVMPCSTRSYEPVTIWTVTGVVAVAVAVFVVGVEAVAFSDEDSWGSIAAFRTLRVCFGASSRAAVTSLFRFAMVVIL